MASPLPAHPIVPAGLRAPVMPLSPPDSPPAPQPPALIAHARLTHLCRESGIAAGALPGLQAALVATPQAHVGHAFSPGAGALGIVATGVGPALAGTVSAVLTRLTDTGTAARFRSLVALGTDPVLRLEVVVGEPAHVRAGVRGVDEATARAALEAAGHGTAEQDRLLGPARQVGLELLWTGTGPADLGVVVRAAVRGEGLEGARAVELTRVAGRRERSHLRRTGLRGAALTDWLSAAGWSGADDAVRLGAVHAGLGLPGPAEIAWTAGALKSTALFFYPPPAPR